MSEYEIVCYGQYSIYSGCSIKYTKNEYEREKRITVDEWTQLKHKYEHEYILEEDHWIFFKKSVHKKEKQGMNYSTAVFLINKNVRAILTVYEDFSSEAEGKRKAVMHKTLDPLVKKGDFVIVPTNTRHKMTVVKVLEVDVDVDFDSTTHVDWIVGRVDKAAYDSVVQQEQQATTTIRSAEAQAKRDELKAKLLKLNEEQIKALPIYANGGATQ